MTASLPVIEYAEAIGADHEALLRALAVSDLITIHQKTMPEQIPRVLTMVLAITSAFAPSR